MFYIVHVSLLPPPAGANYIKTNNNSKHLGYVNLKQAAKDLRIGDIVERHLEDGDPVLFNRQVRVGVR